MFSIHNLRGNKHIITEQKGIFTILEHVVDSSVSPDTAQIEYFMGKMNVRRRQVVIQLNRRAGVILQAGAMQWMVGDVNAKADVKGVGDLFGKLLKSSVTNESTIKPQYTGHGVIVTEPTYKYLLCEDVSEWEGGLVVEDGMFLACENTVEQEIQARSTISSAVVGNEGLFNLKLRGEGACVLESNVPRDEIVVVDLEDDVLKIDGSFAICWSGKLQFTVEKSSKTLIGSAASGEGLVNVYRGTGKVYLAPLTPSASFYEATHNK